MQRLETYSRQNVRMGWINEESHRIKIYNINILKGHIFVSTWGAPKYTAGAQGQIYFEVGLSDKTMTIIIVYNFPR